MAEEKRTLIAEHDTVAVFHGTKKPPCRFKTALCPDQCGHSKESAMFEVTSYHNDVSDHMHHIAFPTAEINEASLAVIKKLKDGEEVHLVFKHEKVEKPGFSGGERTITKVEPASASAAATESRELLATHQTISEFEGVTERKCMHMTSLCPDKCGHGGAVAVFKVLGYTNYEKPGKYGDEKQQRFHVKLAGIGAEKNADVVAKIKALKPNDKVVLDWNHDYVTRGGSKSPERPVVKLEPISAEAATEALAKTTD